MYIYIQYYINIKELLVTVSAVLKFLHWDFLWECQQKRITS